MTATAIALLLYIEAAGEPVDGIRAVASVVHNRAVIYFGFVIGSAAIAWK